MQSIHCTSLGLRRCVYGCFFYFSYYGEMITYLGMTAPMAVLALTSWIRYPYKGNKSEVQVNHLKKTELIFAVILTAVVTLVFYLILSGIHTANIIPSTISVTTSFLAVYLTFRKRYLWIYQLVENEETSGKCAGGCIRKRKGR